MRTRLISLVILLVVGAGAVAGVPLRSNEQSCSVGDAMAGMDCCKAALMKAQAESASARLCCVVNCSQDGSTPPSGVRVSPQSQPVVSDYQPGTPALPASILLTLHISRSHGPPTDSHPAYIRHLALLI